MYIYVTTEEHPRIYLVKEDNEEHNRILETLHLTESRKVFVSNSDLATMQSNKTVVIGL